MDLVEASGRKVAIFRSPLFNASETFVTGHVEALRRYRPVVVGLIRKSGSVAAGVRMLLPSSRMERLALALGLGTGRFVDRIRDESPVLMHAHFGTDGLLALPIAERLGIPLVTTLHGFEVSRHRSRMLLSGQLSWIRYAIGKRRLFERGALFLAVSESVRRRAIEMGFPADRVVMLHNGVDLDRFSPSSTAPEAGLILHVGRLVEKKGTSLLLEAFAIVRASCPKARLAVVGDGPQRRRLERQALLLGIANGIDFVGAVPHDTVLGWMHRAWLLAAPSLTARDGDAEGLPTVLCEAAAAGLPIVASRHSGIEEAVDEGETGFLVAERDASALAERMIGLIKDSGLRGRMSVAARRLAEERFCRVKQGARLESHYDLLLLPGFGRCA